MERDRRMMFTPFYFMALGEDAYPFIDPPTRREPKPKREYETVMVRNRKTARGRVIMSNTEKHIVDMFRRELAYYGFTDSQRIMPDDTIAQCIRRGLSMDQMYGVFCDVCAGFGLLESIDANGYEFTENGEIA